MVFEIDIVLSSH